MKKRNLVIAILLVAFVTIMMTSCYTPAFAPFLGKYSATIGGITGSYEFKADGTVTNEVVGLKVSDTYTFDAKEIDMFGHKVGYAMSNFNKTLTLTENGVDVEFTKE